MTDTINQTEADGPFGFPGDDKVKKLIHKIVDPMISGLSGEFNSLKDSISGTLGTIKDDVAGIVGKTTKLVDTLVVDVTSELKDLAGDVKGMVGAAPKVVSKAAGTLENLAKTALTWEQAKGAQVKQELTTFANAVIPALEKLLSDHGLSTKPVDALRKIEALAGQVDDALFAPLAVLTELVDLQDAASKIGAAPQAIEARKALAAAERGPFGSVPVDKILLTAKAAIAMVVHVLDYISASLPLGIYIGASGGVAAGLEAAAKGDMKVAELTPMVLGLISCPLQIAEEAIDIAVVWIETDSDSGLTDGQARIEEELKAIKLILLGQHV